MSGIHASQQDVDIDLGGLFAAIWKKRMRVLMATVACAGIAFAGASLITPSYKSETRLLIETREPAFTTGADRSSAGRDQPVLDELGIVSQVQLLKSADLIKQVARDMKLYELEEFDPTVSPSAVSDLLVLLGLKKNPLELAPEERVLKEFNEKLAVYQVEKSRVIGIEFSSKDPRLAAEIPNRMAEVYLSLQSGAKLDTNSEATRWLEPEIANLREKVREAEQKVAEYRAQSDLLPTGTGDNATFAVKQLNDISTELARLRGERASAEARAESVRAVLKAGGAPDTLSAVVDSQMIQRLKESEAQIQGQISDLSTSLLEGHPRLKGLRSQLEGIRGQIQAETRKILSSLENEANTARLRETQLVQQLNTLKADTARAGEDEVGLKALEREATAQRQLLETYLARYREATSRTGSNSTPADARIISAAVEPTEVAFPKVLPITLVGGIAGFVLSAIAILLSELFSGRALRPVGAAAAVAVPVVRVREEPRPKPEAKIVPVEPVARKVQRSVADTGALRNLQAPAKSLLAGIGAHDDEEEADEAPAAAAAPPEEESADFSVQAVARHIVDNNISVAISVSPSGDRGSTAAVMLARRIAGEHRKTLLIDLTGSACPTRLMAQSVHAPGITDLLVGDSAFADIIHGDRLSEAHLIPRGNANIKRAMRGIDRLSMVIDSLSNAYDTVIVECGPAEVAAVRRLTRDTDTDIILSLPGAEEDDIIALIGAFGEAGYGEIVLMTGEEGEPSGNPGRHAA